MDSYTHPTPSLTPVNLDPLQAAHNLGELLSQTLEYLVFLEALKAINNDVTLQKLSVEMRAHQTALQLGRDADGQHATALTRLELEIEDMPVVKKYHRAEREVSDLFHAVDEIIGKEAGVAFAVNAQRSGCNCGG